MKRWFEGAVIYLVGGRGGGGGLGAEHSTPEIEFSLPEISEVPYFRGVQFLRFNFR